MAAVSLGPVAIIGLGVIGGSVAKALSRAGADVRAHTASEADAEAARRDGIGVSSDVAGCVADAPLVLIAVPMSAYAGVAVAVVDAALPSAVVLHAASLQTATALAAASPAVPYRADAARRVIGSHPLAGSHRAGFAAASPGLLAGCVVSMEARATDPVRAAGERLWRSVGASRIEYRTAEEHDELMTWVSHLPQLASTALAHAIASAGVDASDLGPGGRDATRLASSSFEMWSGILAGARPGAAQAAAALEQSVGAVRAALETGDTTALAGIWATARQWRETADDVRVTPGR